MLKQGPNKLLFRPSECMDGDATKRPEIESQRASRFIAGMPPCEQWPAPAILRHMTGDNRDMPLVPAHEIYAFLLWLRSKGARPTALNDLAVVYLEQGLRANHALPWLERLAIVLEAFQTCRMVGEDGPLQQMDHFSECGRCTSFGATSTWALHPLLVGFLDWLASPNNDLLLKLELDRWGDIGPQRLLLETMIRDGGRALRHTFREWCEVAGPSLVESYVVFRSQRSAEFERSVSPISHGERGFAEEASRLAKSLRLFAEFQERWGGLGLDELLNTHRLAREFSGLSPRRMEAPSMRHAPRRAARVIGFPTALLVLASALVAFVAWACVRLTRPASVAERPQPARSGGPPSASVSARAASAHP